jgi:hypothetical protein
MSLIDTIKEVAWDTIPTIIGMILGGTTIIPLATGTSILDNRLSNISLAI